ncbi:MAG: hypothetical protein LBQ31_07320 [Bacteroidales bacterium]|jgi:hypothetical protein|nr:hypothetical protein [Bacteroidales bacterium]
MEKDVEKRVLEKILLPINTAWEVSSVSSDELSEEIFVKLHYKYDYIEDNGNRYPIYDHRKMRKWCHLEKRQSNSCSFVVDNFFLSFLLAISIIICTFVENCQVKIIQICLQKN